jgi:hypothetical protein
MVTGHIGVGSSGISLAFSPTPYLFCINEDLIYVVVQAYDASELGR